MRQICATLRCWLLACALVALAAVMPVAAQDGAQSLPTEALSVQSQDGTKHDFIVEIADDAQERSIGMMFRQSVAADKGMLFIYPYPRPLSFWMKNTYIPLDILYIQSDGRIANIIRNAEPQKLDPLKSKGRVKAALEIRGGLAEELGIHVGDYVVHQAFRKS